MQRRPFHAPGAVPGPVRSLVLLVLALGACDGGTDAPVPASVEVEPGEASIEAIGATRQFTARVLDADGDEIGGADVTWTSTQTGVATVDDEGLVTAVGTGSTEIRATASGLTGEATLTVAIPAFTCLPGDGTQVSLARGESMILADPSAFCLTLPSAAGQEYLVGVQSIAESGEQLTNVRVQASTPPGGAASSPAAGAAEPAPRSRGGSAYLDRDALRRAARWRAHTRRMERDVESLRHLAPAARAARAAGASAPARVIDPGMQVGETTTVRVLRLEGQGCGVSGYDEVTVELVWKGEQAWWFDDVENPDAFTVADWQELGDLFDDVTAPVAVEYFGEPFDLDGNGVIAVVFTKRLNEQGSDDEGVSTRGFVNPCDFFERGAGLQQTNEGEFFYHVAADPSGEFGDTIAADALIADAFSTISHEFAHIIQFSRRIERELPPMSSFMLEGQASLSSEVVAHRLFGNQPGMNYGAEVVLGDEERFWYLDPFVDLYIYYGADLERIELVEDAPERCTWTAAIDRPDDPCPGRALWYGVTWSLLRWASDHFGDRFADGEAGLHRRLVDSNLSGLANLASVTGESVSFLLGHWAPMLYVDDRVEGLDPLLTMTSWNLLSMYEDVEVQGQPALTDLLRPHPRERSATDWQDVFEVRSPSFEWYTITTGGQAVALRATTEDRQVLPSHMQMFIVRTQ